MVAYDLSPRVTAQGAACFRSIGNDGAPAGTVINDSFGNSVSSSGTAANPFKWNGGSGYYSDAESGLQKVGARYYDPSVGAWIGTLAR